MSNSTPNPRITLNGGREVDVLAYLITEEGMHPIVEMDHADTDDFDDDHYLVVKLVGYLMPKGDA